VRISAVANPNHGVAAMPDPKIRIAATYADWRLLLDALPHCDACGGLAEVRLRLDARRLVLCCSCAAAHRRGYCDPLVHSEFATFIEDRLLPHLQTGAA